MNVSADKPMGGRGPGETTRLRDAAARTDAPSGGADQTEGEGGGATRHPSVMAAERSFVTVLFTDIVDSTSRALELGDHQWLDLMAAHEAMSRAAVDRFGGRIVRMTGDGMLATFTHVMGGVLCAASIVEQSAEFGIQVRAGLHAGECERRGSRDGGLVFHIGARIAALAGAEEILVSQTVWDLVLGSGLEFEAHGRHALKGLDGKWTVYALRSREADVARMP